MEVIALWGLFEGRGLSPSIFNETAAEENIQLVVSCRSLKTLEVDLKVW